MLCAGAITTTGAPMYLPLDAGNSESYDACTASLRDLVSPGLRPPLRPSPTAGSPAPIVDRANASTGHGDDERPIP